MYFMNYFVCFLLDYFFTFLSKHIVTFNGRQSIFGIYELLNIQMNTCPGSQTHTYTYKQQADILRNIIITGTKLHVKEWSLHFWRKQTYLKREKKQYGSSVCFMLICFRSGIAKATFTAGWVICRACERISCSIYCFFLFDLCCLFDNNVGVTL